MRDDGQSGAPHWSRDFVEHLRTVHFALITVSVGLVLLTVSARPYSPAEAITQLDMLQSGANAWDANKFLEQKTAAYEKGKCATRDEMGECTRLAELAFSKESGAGKHLYAIHIARLWAVSPKLTPALVREYREDPPLRFSEKPEDATNEFAEKPAVENVGSLVLWWLVHAGDKDFVVIQSFNQPGTLGFAYADKKTEATMLEPSGAQKPEGTIEAKLSGKVGFGGEEWSVRGSVDATVSGRNTQFDVTFPVAVKHVKISNRVSSVRDRCLTFERCFPDLANAAEGFQSLKLTDFRNHLTQELEKGDTVFEAFGLKIPIRLLSSWGIVVVLSVQLYFFLHLREFHAKIKKSDSGWDLPWIGVYDSALPRCVYLATVFLPTAAVVLLSVRSGLSRVYAFMHLPDWAWREKRLILGEILLLLMSACLAGLLSWRTWKHRPVLLKEGRAR